MPESILKKYYEGLSQGKIYAHKCDKCGSYTFPPTSSCERCGCFDYTPVEFSGKGTMEYVSHGVNPPPHPRFADIAPYAYGHILLEEGVYVQAIITNVDFSPETLKEYYEKGPVGVVADIRTYADDLPVLGFKVV
jgi:uncharacterized OB-fold protein